MKNKKVNVKVILLIILVIINMIFILINFNNKNIDIEKQEISKEQLTETTENNSYVTMEDHLLEVSNAANEVTNNSEWKLLDTVTGTTEISLPESFKELHIVIRTSSYNITYATNHIAEELSESEIRYSIPSSGTDYYRYKISLTKIYLSQVYIASKDITSNTTLTVWYK